MKLADKTWGVQPPGMARAKARRRKAKVPLQKPQFFPNVAQGQCISANEHWPETGSINTRPFYPVDGKLCVFISQHFSSLFACADILCFHMKRVLSRLGSRNW